MTQTPTTHHSILVKSLNETFTNFQHFYLREYRRQPNSLVTSRHPFACLAMGITHNKMIVVGTSFCSPQDNFSKSVGSLKAYGRLLSQSAFTFDPTIVIPDRLTAIVHMTLDRPLHKIHPNVCWEDAEVNFANICLDLQGMKFMKAHA